MRARTLGIAQFANVVLFALVMGVFWGTWFSLSRSIASVPPGTFLEIGRVITANVAGPMSLLMPAALVSSLIVVVLLARRGRGPSLYLALDLGHTHVADTCWYLHATPQLMRGVANACERFLEGAES